MKRPRPTAPADAPPGVIRLGGEVEWFSVAVSVTDDDLDPEAVSRLLGSPTSSQRKDHPILKKDGTVRRVPRFGQWRRVVKPAATDEWDVAEVIKTLLGELPDDPAVWDEVRKLGEVTISLGLTAALHSQEMWFDTELIALLANCRANIWFDIYKDAIEPP